MTDQHYPTLPLHAERYPEQEMLARARSYLQQMSRRRTVRDFSAEPVPREVIEQCLLTAGSAPSGANRQPWHFSVVGDVAIKRQIREGAEQEEREFYGGKAGDEWLRDLQKMGTDAQKPFLETAPWLIAIFSQSHTPNPDGEAPIKHYYPRESVGIAIAARRLGRRPADRNRFRSQRSVENRPDGAH